MKSIGKQKKKRKGASEKRKASQIRPFLASFGFCSEKNDDPKNASDDEKYRSVKKDSEK